MNSEHNVAIVTGSSRGLGRAMALHLAKMGYDIAISTTYEGVTALFDAVTETLGNRITVLVNNAGIAQHAYFLDTSAEQLARIIQVNLLGAMFCAKQAAPLMKQQGGGNIINISSSGGQYMP